MAMEHCGCVPWDYPIPAQKQGKTDHPICDFYGSSCFNSYIENGLAESCKTECVPGCNEIKYTVYKEEKQIHKRKICSYNPDHTQIYLDLFEMEIFKYISNSAQSSIKRFQEALVYSNDTKTYFYRFCVEKLKYDIAIVDVIMDSPTAMKFIQTLKVTLTDKLANFGE